MARLNKPPGSPVPKGSGGGGKGAPAVPEWAQGLRALYDSVVEEPLPQSFEDLLRELDKADRSDRAGKADDADARGRGGNG